MGGHHSHGHHSHHNHSGSGTRRALLWAFGLNAGFLVVEVIIGLLTGSLALLSDAVHMVSDVGALALALGAAHLAQRGAAGNRTYGFRRAEPLGAFVNGLLLVVACLVIFKTAVSRLVGGSPDIEAWPVLIAGIIGLGINLGSAWHLYRTEQDNLNVRGALVHMLADALGSAGAIVAAILLSYGVVAADAVVSILIGMLVLAGTWGLLRDSGRVLLQFAPDALSVDEVQSALEGVQGAVGVHDLHLWTLDGSGSTVLSVHIVTGDGAPPELVRDRAAELLEHEFGVDHSTIQMEREGAGCTNACCPLMRQHSETNDDCEKEHAHAA